MSKQMSMLEVAVELMKPKKNPQPFLKLAREVFDVKGYNYTKDKEKVAQFYMDLISSAKFVYCGEEKFDLKERQEISMVEKDFKEGESDIKDLEKELKKLPKKDVPRDYTLTTKEPIEKPIKKETKKEKDKKAKALLLEKELEEAKNNEIEEDINALLNKNLDNESKIDVELDDSYDIYAEEYEDE